MKNTIKRVCSFILLSLIICTCNINKKTGKIPLSDKQKLFYMTYDEIVENYGNPQKTIACFLQDGVLIGSSCDYVETDTTKHQNFFMEVYDINLKSGYYVIDDNEEYLSFLIDRSIDNDSVFYFGDLKPEFVDVTDDW